jgi:hypothetical protein
MICEAHLTDWLLDNKIRGLLHAAREQDYPVSRPMPAPW